MNNNTTTFHFPAHLGLEDVRVTDRNGEPWFIAKDVCDVFGLTNTTEALRDLDEDEKDFFRVPEVKRGNPNLLVVNESGLYSLILKSRKPEAKWFKKWVTSEVLPSLREHGGYLMGQEELPEELVSSLHRTLLENVLPALRYYDQLTEHDHYPGISRQDEPALNEDAINKTAVKFDLPPSFVRQLVSYGVKAVRDCS
jgi:prophage antirepressor-like protein